MGGVYGIKIDQANGAMNVVWSRPDWRTSDYFSFDGPPDKRVVISQYLDPEVTFDTIEACLSTNVCNYAENVLWADAATGRTIAQSAYTPSTALGSLANIGYGGRLYMMGNDGWVWIEQPQPEN